MLDIVLCNDNIPELQQLTYLVTKYCQDRPDLPMRVQRFQSLFDFIDAVKLKRSFHICLLDHCGGQSWMNGQSAESLLRQKAPALSIIGFADSDHSSFLSPVPGDPLGLEARLVKPINTIDLYNLLDRLASYWLPLIPDPTLTLSTPQGKRSLPFRQLVRVHYDDHLINCHMADGTVVKSSVQRGPFGLFTQPLLQTRDFSWVSSSCVVNLAFVGELDRESSTARMSDGQVLPVPKAAFPWVWENLQNYHARRNTPILADINE